MSTLNDQQITELAHLCRLELSVEERTAFTGHLQRIVTYMEHLNAIDTSSLSAYSHMEEQGPLRPDEVGVTLARPLFLANAPDQVGGMIRVPTVIHHAQKNS